VTVRGSVSQARAERRRLQAAGRPFAVVAEPDPPVSLTVSALAEQWLRTRHGVLAPNTLAEVEVDLRLRIAPALGHLAVNEVTRQRVEQLVAELLRGGASVRMVRGVVSSLRRLLQAAVDWGQIADNPARRVRLPAPATHTRQAHERVLSMPELSRLIGACNGSLRTETMIRAMAEAGLRRGEVIGLHWEDADLAGLRLHVRRSVSDVRGVRQERTTKGKRSRRVRRAPWRVAGAVRRSARDRLRVARPRGRTDERPLPQPITCARRASGGPGRRRRGTAGDPARPAPHRSQPNARRGRAVDRGEPSAGARQPERDRTGLRAPACR
jgi:integrase